MLSINNNEWNLLKADDRTVLSFIQKFHVNEVVARILAAKNFTAEEAEGFLFPYIKNLMPDPYHLLDMDKAVTRTVEAIKNQEKIVVYGDYDVDGATSAALLKKYFRALGIDILIYIPDRLKEGYGPNLTTLLNLQKLGYTLCITVDCGTVANKILNSVQNSGLDIIIIDHHISGEVLPNVVAIINPNRLDQVTTCNNLAAVGVSFLFIVALNIFLRKQNFFCKIGEPDILEYLDLVALGTVCDLVKLQGLNRALVDKGLKVLKLNKNLGIKTLREILQITESITCYHLGYLIGPHINAAGRVGDSHLGAKLLSTESSEEAYKIAIELCTLNQERKSIESEAFNEALLQIDTTSHFIMVSSKNWHPGIIGIVAGRLKDHFYLPTSVISIKDGIGKASARSIQGINFGALILAAKLEGLLIEGGGHYMAAGFSVEEVKIPLLYTFFMKHFPLQKSNKVLEIAGLMTVEGITVEFCQELEKLSPFGIGNPEPKILIKDFTVTNVKILNDAHISCLLKGSDVKGQFLKAIAFRSVGTSLGEALLKSRVHSVIGRASINYWNGRLGAQFIIEDATY